MTELITKHGIKPQIWMTLPNPKSGNEEEKVEAAAKSLLPFVQQARDLGCKLALYNHGDWGGEPENMAAVCKWL